MNISHVIRVIFSNSVDLHMENEVIVHDMLTTVRWRWLFFKQRKMAKTLIRKSWHFITCRADLET